MECRTCLKVTRELQELFTENCDLPHKIETISSIQILENDWFPSKICYSCVRNVHLLYDFRSIVRRSNMILESRANSAQNEETGESGNDTELLETDLIQIDEIKLESDIESLDLNGSGKVDKDVEIAKDDILKCHDTVLKPNQNGGAAKNTIYKCPECDFTDSDYNFYKCHQRKHNKQVPRSICNFCGKSITKYNLSKHLANHTDTPVTCDICGSVYKHKESLRGHMRVHQNISLQCTFCGKIITNQRSYYKHIQRHKNGGAKNVKCPLCDKLFSENKLVTKHLRTHTGERPYPCEYCKKGFSSSHALKTHVRQHTNEKPFACDFCDMAFPQRVSLRNHMKSKHPSKTSKQQNG